MMDLEDKIEALVLAIVTAALVGLVIAFFTAVVPSGFMYAYLSLYGPYAHVPDIQQTPFMETWVMIRCLQAGIWHFWVGYLTGAIITGSIIYTLLWLDER